MPQATITFIRSSHVKHVEYGSSRQLSIKFAVKFTRFFSSHFSYVQIKSGYSNQILKNCIFNYQAYDIAGALKEKKSVKKKGLTGFNSLVNLNIRSFSMNHMKPRKAAIYFKVWVLYHSDQDIPIHSSS